MFTKVKMLAREELLRVSKKIKGVGIYLSENFSLLEVVATKAQGEKALEESKSPVVVKAYYEVYPSQLEVLSYAQASDLELIIETARKWRSANGER
jgi:hypothetical protein